MSVLGILIGLAAIAPIQVPLGPSTFDSDVCTCEEAIQKHAWCGKCQVGYAAGLKITSALLFEAMDTHGHEIKPETIRCPGCQRAVASDGLCDLCQMGFVGKRLYFTRFTYLLALGKVVDVASLECKTCRESTRAPQWCASCGRGIVGNVQFDKREQFEPAVVEYDRLRTAVEKLKECEDCSIGIFMRARCIRCKIDYGAADTPADEEPDAVEDRAPKVSQAAGKPSKDEPE